MTIKLTTWNVNGIRAVSKKNGFKEWLESNNADIINFQEVRATREQIPPELLNMKNYHSYFNEAEKKGYSGVATYTNIKPVEVTRGLGIEEFDKEGRVLKIRYPEFTLYNIYFPNGGSGAERLDYKLAFCDAVLNDMLELTDRNENVVVTGDYNTAHEPIDVHNPASCKGMIGYLPEERAWMDKLEKSGFIDTFRMFNKDGENYTWWSYRAHARERNAGWRIDYFYVNSALKNNVKNATIDNNVYGSDHCPVTLELDF